MDSLATAREIQTHQTLVGLQDRIVGREVRRGSGVGLHVHTPFLLVQVEGLQSTVLAESLQFIDHFRSSVVTMPRDSLAVLVREAAPESLEHSPGSEVLRASQRRGGE